MSSVELDIAQVPGAWRWMKEIARTDPDLFWRLIRPNALAFEQLWGRGAKQDNEGHPRAWRFREQGLQWSIATGPAGSLYRVVLPAAPEAQHDPRLSTGILSFLQDLSRQITALDG